MRNFFVAIFILAGVMSLVWLALRPGRGTGSGSALSSIERIDAEELAWIERDPTTGRVRLKVEADTALRHGDTTTTGPIRAWLYPETGNSPPTCQSAAKSAA